LKAIVLTRETIFLERECNEAGSVSVALAFEGRVFR
jgi:hypothetical protein